MSEIQITVKPRKGVDERRALQAALKYMGRLGLCCIGIRDGQPQPPHHPPTKRGRGHAGRR